jgi:ribosomal protein L11 methyltransferase
MNMKYFEVDFNIKPVNRDAADLLESLAGDAGFESFDDNGNNLKGYVQRDLFDEATLTSVISNFPIKGIDIDYKVKEAEDRDWNKEWEEEGFEPIFIGNLCVIHDTKHLPKLSLSIDITIDAKLAFGTGTHETTRMITDELLSRDISKCSVLDCGCGTGILSFVAAKRGAEKVTGYDIDEWSVKNAMHNASINNIKDFKAYLGDCTILSKNQEIINRGPFDIVIANINRNILIHDMPWFYKVMKKGGILILSGFYQEDANIIEKKAKEYGLKRIKVKEKKEWCCCVFQSLSSS